MVTTVLSTWCTFALFIICVKTGGTSERCTYDKFYVIRSVAPSGLVLDATEPSQLKIQYYIDSNAQVWIFERGDRPGLFYIINRATGKVLDVKSDSYLYVNTRTNSSQQQWFLDSRGKITNYGLLKNVDVQGAKFEAGVPVLVWKENFDQNVNQKFILQEKVAMCKGC